MGIGGFRIAVRVLLALVGAALAGGVAMAAAGLDPVGTWVTIVEAAVGTGFGLHESLVDAVPITLTALGVAIAYRASLFNLGGEGQIAMGALAGVLVALGGRDLPAFALAPLVLVAGMLAGCAWGAVAGALRASLGLSEIITTIMLNFIALEVVGYLIRGPLKDPQGGGYPYTPQVPAPSRLGSLLTVVPAGLLVCLAAAAVIWVALERSRVGLAVKDIGEGERAVRFAGLRVGPYVLGALAFAGALGGLAGAAELTGDQLRLSDGFSPGWGYDAVAVALIGRGSPLGTLAAGLFIGFLRSGIDGAQVTASVPAAVAQIVQAATVLLLVVANSDVVTTAARRARRSLPLPRRSQEREARRVDAP
jgi:ABC-type uncharacterized transport system permease subunit